jgi:hypothetical protein
MPVIPTERRGRETLVNPLTLRAIMAFPKDEEERHRYLATCHGRVFGEVETFLRQSPDLEPYSMSGKIGEHLGRVLGPLGGFSVLSQAPSYLEMERRAGDSSWPGAIAGDLLNSLIQMRAAGLQASVSKAVAIAVDFLADATATEGTLGGKTERYVRQAWENFKPVCHLWAAHRTLEPVTGDRQERVDILLALSHVLLDFALTLRPKGAREPLLRAEDMWRLPRRYNHRGLITHFKIPSLEDWKQDVLRRYKARKP